MGKQGLRDLTGVEGVGLVRLATAVRKTVVLASYTPPSAEALCREKDSYPAAVEVLYRVIEFAGVTQRGWGRMGSTGKIQR